MKVDGTIFRQYDIRGRADAQLTDAFVTHLGRAFGTVVRRNGGTRVALGRDVRMSGPRLFAALSAGVRSTGVDVVDLGEVGTPLVYFALHQLGVDGGVAITGSHNPSDWNGFKLNLGKGSIYGDAIQHLRALIEAEDYETGAGGIETADAYAPYTAWICENIKPGSRPLKVVVDAGNGTGGLVGPELYRRLGFEVIEIFCEPDGTFPNHHPDPTVEANLKDLKAAVIEHGADLGIAYDGDSDRIGAVDHLGRVVWGDQQLLLFARDVLENHPGASFVSEVKCSRVLYDGIAEAGGVAEMWKVGHSLIKARMKETGALLAGEMSGHIFFADRFFGFDDGVYVGARLLELLSHRETRLADFLDGLPKTITTPELRVTCADTAKFDVVARAVSHFKARYDVNDIDGARINFASGWGLIRASNTGPVLVMRFEADTEANLAAYRGEVEAWIAASAPEVDLAADPNH
jgi:phosphomannomutase/phosphoglucomutase